MGKLLERAERLLRWSEKYMKTDMVYLAKGGFWLTLGQGASTVAGLLLVIGFANLLPKEVYGNYKYILSLAGIIGAFTLSGMGIAVTQAISRGMEGMLRTGFWVQLKWSVFMALAGFAGATYYFIQGDRVIAICLLIVGAFSPFLESTALYGSFLNGKKDFRTAALANIFRRLIPVAALLLTVLFTQNVVLIVFAYFLSHTATSVALYLWVLKKYDPAPLNDYSNIGFSKHVSLTNILSIVASHLDKVLIFHYLGAVQLAAYGIAFSLPAQLKIVMKTLDSLVFPKMSSASLQTIRSAIYPKALRLFLGFGFLIAVYIFAAPLIYRLIFPQYLEAIPISQAIAIGYMFAPAMLYSQAFYALKRQRDIYALKIITSVSRILLLLILLPAFGIWGAVFAFFLGNAVGFAASIIIFKRLRE